MATVAKARSATSAGATSKTPTTARASAGARPTATSKASTAGKTASGKTTSTLTTGKKLGAAVQAAPAPAARPKFGMGRFFTGMLIYLFGSYVIQFILAFLDVKVFNSGLSRTVLFKFPFGTVNVMVLLFMASLVALLWALYKFKVLPSATEMRAQNQAALDQRNAARASAAKGTATRGNLATKNVVAPPAPTGIMGRLTNFMASANAKRTATTQANVSAADEPGEHDELYDQVRSQLRAQARKQRKH
jgi:hypothetical protein